MVENDGGGNELESISASSNGARAATARRTVLRWALAGSAATLGWAGGIGRGEAQATVRVRRNIAGLALDHPVLVTYRAAVAYMRSLPGSDRRSWAFQANIHNNRCPHGNWYFLPWHREYLLAFENIIRSLPVTGASSFALPYWDWTSSPELPQALTSPSYNGSTNPLYDPSRLAGRGDRLPPELTGRPVMNGIYGVTGFETFASSRPFGQNSTGDAWQRAAGSQGPLEATPHNSVHNWIQGNMASFFSPRDPVFWLHHGNIDRIWASWNAQGKPNTTAGYWRNFTFRQNFASSNGGLYNIIVRDVRMNGYRYDRLDPAPGAALVAEAAPATPSLTLAADSGSAPGETPVLTARAANTRSAALGRPASIAVTLDGQARAAAAGSTKGRLRLLGIEAPPVANAPFVRVFLNHPAIGPDTPPSGPHYVGTIAFFGTPAQHTALHGKGGNPRVSFELPITATLEKLRRSGELPDPIVVQLVPVALRPTVRQVEIAPTVVEIELE